MKKFTVSEAKTLVEDAVRRSQKRHALWQSLSEMFRYGGNVSTHSYAGALFDEMTSDDLERVNLVLPRIQLMVARLTARDPRPVAQSMSGTELSEQQERVVESVLQHFFNKNYGVSIIRDLASDLVITGNAFAKVAWSFKESEEDIDEDEIEEQVAMLALVEEQAARLEQREPLSEDEIRDGLEKTRSIVVEDSPYIAYVRPFDIFVPASARRLHEARWVAQRIVVPLSEANERFPSADLAATDITSDMYLPDEMTGRDDEEELITLYELWDAGTKTLLVFTESSEKALYDGPFPYAHSELPFVHMANHREKPSDLMGFGDMEAMAGLQNAFNAVWTKIVDSTFRSGRKYIASTGTLTDEAIEALESDIDDQIVMVDGPAGQPVNELIVPLFRQPISNEVLQTQGQLMGLLDQVMAFNDFDTGGSGSDRMSATAAAAVMGVAEQRAANKQLLLEEGCSRIYELMLSLLQEFLTTDTAIKLVGPQGSAWEQVTGADLQGEFRIRVETGSMNGQTRAMRQAEGMQILTQLVPLLQSMAYDTDGLTRSALNKMGINPDEVALNKIEPQQPELPAGPPDGGVMSQGASMEMLTGMPDMRMAQEGGAPL